MRGLRWTGGIACTLFAILTLSLLALTPIVDVRQASVKPLNRETLAALGMELTDEDPASSSPMGERAREATSAENTAADDTAPEIESAPQTKLTRQPAEEEVAGRYTTHWERGFTHVYLGGLKRIESAIWLSTGNSANGFALEIGLESYRLGDFRTARTYLREALQVETRPSWRECICGRLAWLEEDPETATLLLRESCASDKPNRLSDAMRLAILTDSDDLADHYFDRWAKAVGDEEVANAFALQHRHPRIEAWLENKKQKPAINSRKPPLTR